MSESKTVIGKASSPKWREQRRTILLEIIAADPTQRWSVRNLAKAARANPTIAAVQPRYGNMTAHRDWLVVREEMASRREELASDYISGQLDLTDDLLLNLKEDFDNLSNIDLSKIEDEDMKASIVLERIKAKKDLVAAMDRIMARQQTLVPTLAVPKKIAVDQRHLSMTLDQFLEIKKKAMEIGPGDVIDGEVFENVD